MPDLPMKDCTGCTACAMLCPTGAITMEEDCEGFLRPKINNDKCVGCNICQKYCPVHTQAEIPQTPQHGVYAVKTKNGAAHKRSQSGGAFYALAQNVLERGGVVYGAALNKKFKTEHIRVERIEQLEQLQGVKYVQSDLGDSFVKVAMDLSGGTEVLFSGTPCQVAGLKAYLSKKKINTDRLLTADLVCYGAPSPGVFRSWVQCLEKAYKSKLVTMCFRRTDVKWGKGKEYYLLANGKVLEGEYFTGWYFRNYIIRPGCEHCRFCNTARPGDLTLGDFWGIDKVMPDFYDDRGVSLVICSTEKGKQALERVRSVLEIRESTLADAVASQPRLRGIAVKPNPGRESFWKRYGQYNGMAHISIDEGFIPPTLQYRIAKKVEAVKQRFKKWRM